VEGARISYVCATFTSLARRLCLGVGNWELAVDAPHSVTPL
jgi:hypothetical protein